MMTKIARNTDTTLVGSRNGGDSFGSVAFNRKLNKWATAVAVSGRMKFLGYHDTEQAATHKVAEAARTWALSVSIRRHE